MRTKVKINILAYVLDTPTSCQEISSLFHSCWKYVLLMVFLPLVSMRYWLDLSIYTFHRCCICQKNPQPTKALKRINSLLFLYKMDIFKDNCPSLRTQNNCLTRTVTWVFSIPVPINLSLVYEISSIFKCNINTKLTLQAYI